MGSRLKLIGRMAISIVLLIGLLTGCTSSKSDIPAPTKTVKDQVLDIAFVAWKTSSEAPNSCAQGPEVADFLDGGATVRVYDNSTGELLASGVLKAFNGDYAGVKGCRYELSGLKVPFVETYRTVIDGRHTVISTAVELKVNAQEFTVNPDYPQFDLFLIKEFGIWQ
jgi:hypothetical protein